MIALLIAMLATLVCGVVLSVVDLREHRLPNRWVLALTVIVLPSLAIASWLAEDLGMLVGALLGGLAMSAIYLAIALISPRSMGMGDVKLAFPLGALVGWFGWEAWFLALFGAFLIGGLAALVLMLMRRAGARTQLAFGPAMIAAALIVAGLALDAAIA